MFLFYRNDLLHVFSHQFSISFISQQCALRSHILNLRQRTGENPFKYTRILNGPRETKMIINKSVHFEGNIVIYRPQSLGLGPIYARCEEERVIIILEGRNSNFKGEVNINMEREIDAITTFISNQDIIIS